MLLLILAKYQKSLFCQKLNKYDTQNPSMRIFCFNICYPIQMKAKMRQYLGLNAVGKSRSIGRLQGSIKLIFKMDRYRHIPNNPNQLVMSSSLSWSSPSSSIMRVAGCRIPITCASALPLMLASFSPCLPANYLPLSFIVGIITVFTDFDIDLLEIIL